MAAITHQTLFQPIAQCIDELKADIKETKNQLLRSIKGASGKVSCDEAQFQNGSLQGRSQEICKLLQMVTTDSNKDAHEELFEVIEKIDCYYLAWIEESIEWMGAKNNRKNTLSVTFII